MNYYRKSIIFGLFFALSASITPIHVFAEEEVSEPEVTEEITEEEPTEEIVPEESYESLPEEEEAFFGEETADDPERTIETDPEPVIAEINAGGKFDYAETLTLNVEADGASRYPGDTRVFKFVPSESNFYSFRSYVGNGDGANAQLCKPDGTVLAGGYDGAEGNNFRIVYFLDAGNTYYLTVFQMDYKVNRKLPVKVTAGGALFGYEGDTTLSANPGGSGSFKVNVQGRADRVTLQWYRGDTLLSGETKPMLNLTNINRSEKYHCHCNDGYGFEKDVWFETNVDNQLILTPIGDQFQTVNYNDPAVMEFSISANDTTDMKITWYEMHVNENGKDYEYKPVGGAIHPSYSIPHVTHSADYYVSVIDRYGNEETLNYGLRIPGGLGVSSVGDVIKYVRLNGSIKVSIKAEADDPSGIRYRWYRHDGADEPWVPLGTADSEVISGVTQDVSVKCVVTDKYNNFQTRMYSLRPDNQLKAEIRGGNIISVTLYGTAYLNVDATAIDTSSLSFIWYKSKYDYSAMKFVDSWIATTPQGSYTLANLQEATPGKCVVYDQYGNTATAEFGINIIEDYQIALRKALLYLVPGQSETLIADGEPHKNWTTSHPAIASVDQNGKVTAKDVGIAFINVYDDEHKYGASCTVRCMFADVADQSAYYFDPVYWAFDKKITVGHGGKFKFSPNAACTREQIVTFLWRLMGEPEPLGYQEFTDVKETDWYYKPISWAASRGITVGLNDGTGRFGVGQACTREQCVTFLYRAAGKPAVGAHTEFTDVTSDRYYYDAISWAASNEITVGLNDGTGRFGVGQKCTRAMIVTFLRRYAIKYPS
ncbi:MAG: S-layer homology domain-containing protein [Erysipelotrichaceae bacterium]|nr:S-layer homology domain-containing protein [Erysipelotrichaceae bacterium]